MGNHDKRSLNGAVKGCFAWVKDYYELKIEEQYVVLCHFPFQVWNKAHYGSWHLHGHSHGNLEEDLTKKRMDVGVDRHGYNLLAGPLDLNEVKVRMADRSYKAVDHHGAD